MNKRRRIYEGKAKVLYEGPEPGTLIQHFKDDATAFNAKKHALIEGKGVLNNRISEYIFLRLGEIGVPTHFIKRLNMREQLIREVEIVPLEVVVRNVAAGSLSTRLGPRGRRAASALDHRVLLQERRAERSDGLGGAHHGVRLGNAAGDRRDHAAGAAGSTTSSSGFSSASASGSSTSRSSSAACGTTSRCASCSPTRSAPTAAACGTSSRDKLDKDRFRRDLGGVLEAYQEVARRLGVLTETPRPRGSGPVLVASNPVNGPANGKPN